MHIFLVHIIYKLINNAYALWMEEPHVGHVSWQSTQTKDWICRCYCHRCRNPISFFLLFGKQVLQRWHFWLMDFSIKNSSRLSGTLLFSLSLFLSMQWQRKLHSKCGDNHSISFVFPFLLARLLSLPTGLLIVCVFICLTTFVRFINPFVCHCWLRVTHGISYVWSEEHTQTMQEKNSKKKILGIFLAHDGSWI